MGSFAFSPDGEWLLIRPQGAQAAPAADGAAGAPGGRGGAGPADAPAGPGTDLLMRHLASGTQRYIGKVGGYAFDEAGKLMAYSRSRRSALGNGVYLMTLASGDQKTLDAATAEYDQLVWSTEGAHLAVLRGDKVKGKTLRENVVLSWRNAGTPEMQAATFDPAKAASFPKDMVLSEFTAPRWSKDGARVFVGIKEQEPRSRSTDPQANVDVWHWKDDDPQSVQIVQIAAVAPGDEGGRRRRRGGHISPARRRGHEDDHAHRRPDVGIGRIETTYRGKSRGAPPAPTSTG